MKMAVLYDFAKKKIIYFPQIFQHRINISFRNEKARVQTVRRPVTFYYQSYTQNFFKGFKTGNKYLCHMFNVYICHAKT